MEHELAARAYDAAVFVVDGWDGSESLKDAAAVQPQLLIKAGIVRHFEPSDQGDGVALLVIDNGKAICEAVSNHVPLLQDEATKQLVDASILAIETTTFTLRGPAVSQLKHATIMQLCYSVNNEIDISIKEEVLTLCGYWEDISKVRDKIYKEMLKTTQDDDNQNSQVTHTPPADAGSSLPATNYYDYVSQLKPDVVELTLQLWKGNSQAVKYDSGQSTVHFTFPTQQELEHAMHSFEQEYQKYEELVVEYSVVELPPKVTSDDSHAFIISEVESSVENTHVRWDPQNQLMKIWSTNLDQAVQLLKDKLESLLLSTAQSPPTHTVSKVKELNIRQARAMNLEASSPIQREIQLTFTNGHTVTLRQGNILHECVDAIVNPANPLLRHGGGLARQIDRASNGQVSLSSREIIAKRGKLNPSDVDFTVIEPGNGSLKCRYIIHAVGPNAHEINSDATCKMLLEKTVQSVLLTAEKRKVTSLAVPAISSGIFGMDKDVVAEVVISVITNYMTQQVSPTDEKLGDIRIVILDKETYYPFQRLALGLQNSMRQFTEV